MFNFGKPVKTAREQARDAKRDIGHSQRDLEREKMALERQEKQLIADIKRAAKEGNAAGTKILAKQLIQLRQQKDKMVAMKSQLGGISMQTSVRHDRLLCTWIITSIMMQAMSAQMTMVTAMEKSTKVQHVIFSMRLSDLGLMICQTMAAANKQMDTSRFQKVIMEYEKQSELMGMREEMIQDSLIDAFDDDEIEEEGDAVVDQVLAEIGLDLGTQMADAPKQAVASGFSIEQLLQEAEAARPKAFAPASLRN
ncbi:Aste57867_22037 [Aphanomyces stellatus]|uniref:Aste57867_22037 protein n=1 Tax=Aphanomyces stellatus TaxID=120398 RepID=A0A485LJU7_9STRA|nr:hypothetical protein As57867_021968 [Aphanomyces stellatus]VFT98705.1 Aste57867_22037 [Aphanomyces stellatus]